MLSNNAVYATYRKVWVCLYTANINYGPNFSSCLSQQTRIASQKLDGLSHVSW